MFFFQFLQEIFKLILQWAKPKTKTRHELTFPYKDSFLPQPYFASKNVSNKHVGTSLKVRTIISVVYKFFLVPS